MSSTVADCPLWNAQYHARHAADNLVRAEMLKRMGEKPGCYATWGMDHLREAAAALGYDLVQREPTKQSEAA